MIWQALWQPQRFWFRLLIVAALLGSLTSGSTAIALAQPWRTTIIIGGLTDYPYLRNFHAAEYSQTHQVAFRWTRPGAALVLPGAGHIAPLVLRVHGNEPDESIRLDAGSGPFTVSLRMGWQRLWLLPHILETHRWSGDLLVSIAASAHTSIDDPRERGVALSSVTIHGRGGGAEGQSFLIGLSIVVIVLLAGWVSQRLWVGATMGGIALVMSLITLLYHQGEWRLLLTCYTGRLVLVLCCGSGLVWGASTLLQWLHRNHLVPIGPRWQRMLGATALLAFLLRFGAMAYPLNFISDLRFSIARATMVREGQLGKLFFPNPALTPVQWETDATIPRSPFYYILAAPLTVFPGRGDLLAMMGFSSAIDAFAVLLVGILIRLAGGTARGMVIGALLAGSSHFGLLAAASWGLFPTLLAQMLVLFALAFWAWCAPSLHERWGWGGLTIVLTLAYLAYPTGFLFLGLTWSIALILLMFQRQWIVWKWSLVAGALAGCCAVVLFYGWHIPAMVEKTFPMLIERFVEQAPGRAADPLTFRALFDPIWWPLYAKFGPLVLSAAGGGGLLLLLATHPWPSAADPRHTARIRQMRTLIASWLLTYPFLALASAYVVTFIVKDVLYMLPAVAVCGGIFLGQIARYRVGKLVTGIMILLVGWEGVHAMLHAIQYAFSELK